ncbi:uncharacterized protein [Antennarius striatus]|uniref:uncharacterized protein n=1 Tax=Antennarius striatus TaxID=241820 RepID=UPI0035B3340C
MSADTGSPAEVHGVRRTTAGGRRTSGQLQAQCTPLPLPALGTQRVIQGNGTNVGTVIALQCPEKHKLVGSEMMCVTDTNSTHWVGDNYCKPLTPYEEYGFRVAVLASIVSAAIILLLSVAFITCCLLDCMKEDKKKRRETESDLWRWRGGVPDQEDIRSPYRHKGRNNNNNTQDEVLSLWDTCTPDRCDPVQVCRCHHQYVYGPAHTYTHNPLLSALPGHMYNQHLLPQNPEPGQTSGPPPQYFGPPQIYQTMNPGLVQTQTARPGPVWQNERQPRDLSGPESSIRSMNPPRERSIRVISV